MGTGRILPSLAVMLTFNLSHFMKLAEAGVSCENTDDCFLLSGYVCINGVCRCKSSAKQSSESLFACTPVRHSGDMCLDDYDCQPGDPNLVCHANLCYCRSGWSWNDGNKRCYMPNSDIVGRETFDAVRDLVIPGIVVMTIGAMVYLGIKVFCSCGKFWRRRRRPEEFPRQLEEPQATFVASYRVFSSLNGIPGMDRSPTILSPNTPFPSQVLHPPTCTGLYVPTMPTTPSAPPPYEEALKHKIILSSYPMVPLMAGSAAAAAVATTTTQLFTEPGAQQSN